VPSKEGDAFVAEAEDLVGLGAGGDFEGVGAVDGVDFGFAAEGGFGVADGLFGVDVEVAALEFGVLADLDEGVEVAGGAAVEAGFAFAADAQAGAEIEKGFSRRSSSLETYFDARPPCPWPLHGRGRLFRTNTAVFDDRRAGASWPARAKKRRGSGSAAAAASVQVTVQGVGPALQLWPELAFRRGYRATLSTEISSRIQRHCRRRA
jgi:hypothetical protein